MKRMWYLVALAVLTPVAVGIVIAQDVPKTEVKEVEIFSRHPPGFPGAPVTAEWTHRAPHLRSTFGIVRGLSVDFAKDNELKTAIEEYRKAESEKDKSAKLETINKLVNEQFDARQKARDAELKQLEANLKKLRDTHSKRESEKESIVKDRVRQLLRDSDGLGWGDDDAPADVLYGVPHGEGLKVTIPAGSLQTK